MCDRIGCASELYPSCSRVREVGGLYWSAPGPPVGASDSAVGLASGLLRVLAAEDTPGAWGASGRREWGYIGSRIFWMSAWFRCRRQGSAAPASLSYVPVRFLFWTVFEASATLFVTREDAMIGFLKDVHFFTRMQLALPEHFGRQAPLLAQPNKMARDAAALIRKGGMNPVEGILALVLAAEDDPVLRVHFPDWTDDDFDFMVQRGYELSKRGLIRPETFAVLTNTVPDGVKDSMKRLGVW